MITALAVVGVVVASALIGAAVEFVGDLLTGDVDVSSTVGSLAFVAALVLGVALVF